MGDITSEIFFNDQILNEILTSVHFIDHYQKYKVNKTDKFNKLKLFLDNIEINKNYYHLSVPKNRKFKKETCNDTVFIKNINSLVNKLTDQNYNTIYDEILTNIPKKQHLIPLIIENIIEKSILHHNYIHLYIKIFKNLNNNEIILKYCDKYYELFFNKEIEKNESKYLELCNINKRTDNIIGFSLLITYLEKEDIINNYIDKVIDPFINNILINENELEIYQILVSFYNIRNLYYKEIPEKYVLILNELKLTTGSSKIKFKIMDILGE